MPDKNRNLFKRHLILAAFGTVAAIGTFAILPIAKAEANKTAGDITMTAQY